MGAVHYFFIAAAIATGTAFSFFFTPIANKIAFMIDAVDVPNDERRMHSKPIARLGGLAIYIAFMISVFIFGTMTSYLGVSKQLYGILIGAFVIIVLGIFDDIYALRARYKFSAQILAAVIVASFDVRININQIFYAFSVNSSLLENILSFIVTVLWIVAITNALNLIDGLDGLATGITVIATASFLIIMIMISNIQMAILSACLVGASIGFIPFNKNPALIFMGDTGALFLGFILACFSVHGLYSQTTIISLAVPFLIMALPIFDTCYAFARRIAEKRSPFSPDRLHIHHKLIDLGLSQSRTVAILYVMSIGFAGCSIFIINFRLRDAICLSFAVFILMIGILWFITSPVFNPEKHNTKSRKDR